MNLKDQPAAVPLGPPAMEGAPTTPPSADEVLLARALEQFEAAAATGPAPDVEAFCALYPTIAGPLRQILTLGSQLAALGRASSTAAPQVPATLGPYQLLGELGRGGMAPVYRARDSRLQRDVALKVLLPEANPASSRRQRFLREARILARQQHPNIVAIHDAGEDGPWCYLAMELLQRSLASEVPAPVRTPLPPQEVQRAVRWTLEAAQGLQHAHARGILHRDIKPANLLLDAELHVRVADFGLAAIEDTDRLTRPGAAVGTLGFAAPEQVRGEPLDARCDVYGLGATLRALLGLQLPLPSTGTGGLATAVPHPEALLALLRRATAQDAADRYPDIAALAADLRAWMDGRPVQVTDRRPSSRKVLIGAALALALVLALAAWRLWPPAQPPLVPPTAGTTTTSELPPAIRVSVASEAASMAGDGGRTQGTPRPAATPNPEVP